MVIEIDTRVRPDRLREKDWLSGRGSYVARLLHLKGDEADGETARDAPAEVREHFFRQRPHDALQGIFATFRRHLTHVPGESVHRRHFVEPDLRLSLIHI